MFILVTAKIDSTKTKKMRFNSDNIVSYGPAESAPCMIMALDGQTYPIMQTPEQLDELFMHNGVAADVPLVPNLKTSTIRKRR